MDKQWQYIIAIIGGILLGGCTHHRPGEVVESAYIPPLFPEPKYSFARNGSSSVDIQECEYLSTPLDYIYESGLREARLGAAADYDHIMGLYREGDFGFKPREEIAKSEFASSMRAEVRAYIDGLIDASAAIAGRGKPDYVEHRRQEAKPGNTGYVGKNIGDRDIYFVDEKGFVVADIFKYAVMGAVYLDKVLNIHLDPKTLGDEAIRMAHESVTLPSGRNYTVLEHHWDLAYGYYAFWRPLAQAEGIPALRDSEYKIFRAFVEGRVVMDTFRYSDMLTQAKIIREELARVLIIRAMHLLVGPNTMANLEEKPKYAFRFISQACGLIYSAKFIRDAEGKPYFTQADIEDILQSLGEGEGLWDSKRLLSDAATKGSLRNIAMRLGQAIGITPEDIKK